MTETQKAQADARKLARNMSKMGKTNAEIAQALFDAGYKSKITGKALTPNAIYWMLNRRRNKAKRAAAPKAASHLKPGAKRAAAPKAASQQLRLIHTILEQSAMSAEDRVAMALLTF